MLDNKNQELNAIYYGITAVLLWSTVAVGFKLGLQVASPLQLLFVGTAFSATFFLGLVRSKIFSLNKTELILGVGLGVLNPFAYYLILFEAYDRLPAHIAQPLNYTWAITFSLLAIPILKQKLESRQVWGILVSYGGVFILLTRGDLSAWNQFDPLGVSLALASTLVWASYWLVTTKITHNTTEIMGLSFVVGFLLTSLVCWKTSSFPQMSAELWLYGAWVGFIEMGFTYLLWQKALAKTKKVARISQLIFLSPIISLMLIATFLGEDIHWTAAIALLVIITGILLTNRRTNKIVT